MSVKRRILRIRGLLFPVGGCYYRWEVVSITVW